jgi:hypothetical protein
MIPLSKRFEILQRTGKYSEAKELVKNSRWYQCGKLYYRPFDDMTIDKGRVFKQIQDISQCTEVPFEQIDQLDSLAGIALAATVTHVSQPQLPRKRCCGA